MQNDPLAAVKPCVARLCDGLNRRDLTLIAEQLGPEARWTIVGRPDRFPFGGTRERSDMLQRLADSLGGFAEFAFEVISAAGNDDVAFIEARVHGRGAGDAVYSNHYLMHFTFRDGLIADVLEHYDPFEALAYVEQLSSSSETAK